MKKFSCFLIYIISLVSSQLTYANTDTDSITQEDSINCLFTFRMQNSGLNLHPENITSVEYSQTESYIYQDIHNGSPKVNGINIVLSQQTGEALHNLTENNIGQVLDILWCDQVISQAILQSAVGNRLNIWLPPETARAIYRWVNSDKNQAV